MNKNLSQINELPKINHWFNNFFWYQYKPVDEREREIFLKIYEKSFFTLSLQITIIALIFYIFRSFLIDNINSIIQKVSLIDLILFIIMLIMMVTYYQGYKILKHENISYKRRGAGLHNLINNIPALIFGYEIAYWTLVIGTKLFNIFR